MRLEHEFVDYIPEELVNGRLYVSTRFGTVVHLCACGCGEEVVTPLGPSEWKVTFDGVTVSLTPSVGNWGFLCRSHYWICRSEVQWARLFDDLEIEHARQMNRARRSRYFGRKRHFDRPSVDATEGVPLIKRLWQRIVRFLLK